MVVLHYTFCRKQPLYPTKVGGRLVYNSTLSRSHWNVLVMLFVGLLSCTLVGHH